MRFAVVLFSVITAALAQFTINTPTGAITCLNQEVTWTGGTAPYVIQVQPGGDPTQAALETFTGLTGTSYSWFVIEPANTQVFLRIRDASGTTRESGTFTIRAGGTCTSSASTPAGSTSAGGTTPPVTTPPATTPTTAAPGGTTSSPAASSAGTGSSSAATTRATTSTGAAGLKMGVTGGVVGVVAGVMALLA